MKKILFLFLIFSFLATNATYKFLENITDSAQLEKSKFEFYYLLLRKSYLLENYKVPIIDSHVIDKFKKEGKKFFICFTFQRLYTRSQHIYSFEYNVDLERLFIHYEKSLDLKQITMFHNGKRDEIKNIEPQLNCSCIIM